jgi:hypothetical protein
MELPTPLTTPEVEFRKHYRDKWIEFLDTPAGRSFFQVIFSYQPGASPSDAPHKDSHSLGQQFFYKSMITLLFYNLKLPLQDITNDVPQNYPREDDTNPNSDQLI